METKRVEEEPRRPGGGSSGPSWLRWVLVAGGAALTAWFLWTGFLRDSASLRVVANARPPGAPDLPRPSPSSPTFPSLGPGVSVHAAPAPDAATPPPPALAPLQAEGWLYVVMGGIPDGAEECEVEVAPEGGTSRTVPRVLRSGGAAYIGLWAPQTDVDLRLDCPGEGADARYRVEVEADPAPAEPSPREAS